MSYQLSRRSLLASMAAAPLALKALNANIPIGLELYSVRGELKKDDFGTLERVAKMGYQVVEFYAPYYDWDKSHAEEVGKRLADLGLRCYSTHNARSNFTPEKIEKAIELNHAIGSRFMVMSSAGEVTTLDGWKQVADLLNQADDTLKNNGMHSGYHNHDAEWKRMDGTFPLRVIADSTHKSVMMQFDVGTCVATGNDPVAWIESNPGRIKSVHLKDWSPDKKYRVLFGQGISPWKKIFAAAESVGGVEYYLMEQEGSDHPEFETAQLCLDAYKQIHA